MSILTASPARVIRSFSRTLPPVKETRTAPVPATPFGLGLEDYTVVAEFAVKNDPTQAVAITEAEDCGYRYTVRHFKAGVEVATLGFDSLGDAKAMAWHLSEPMPVEPEVKAVRKPATRPVNRPHFPLRAKGHSKADELWWAANSPSCRVGFFVEGTTDPYATENLTLSAFDFHVNEMMQVPDGFDHFGSDYLSHEEGVAL